MIKHSMDFGKKERVLNYCCQTYQLSRPSKVGEVMAFICKCQPNSLEEWEAWYFEHAYTKTKNPCKIEPNTLKDLGSRLYEKIVQIVIPEWKKAFEELTEQDCIDYIYNLTINRTYDGYIREKCVINDGFAKIFPTYQFEESEPELDHSGDVDYIMKVKSCAIGFQIKPITAESNFGSFSLSERMQHSFDDFKEQYGGCVFIIFSLKGEIANTEVIADIQKEIDRLELL